MKWDTLNSCPLHSTPSFTFCLSQNLSPPHVSLFLIEIDPLLSGQIPDETWYTWWHLAFTNYKDDHSQNQ